MIAGGGKALRVHVHIEPKILDLDPEALVSR